MTYLGLVNGAKGIIYWSHYNMRVLPQYDEMWGWMKEIGQEVIDLSPAIMSPDDLGAVAVSPVDAPIETQLKRHDGKYYLLAVSTAPHAQRVELKCGASAYTGAVTVKFEERNVEAKKGQWSDTFEPLAVHVYEWAAE